MTVSMVSLSIASTSRNRLGDNGDSARSLIVWMIFWSLCLFSKGHSEVGCWWLSFVRWLSLFGTYRNHFSGTRLWLRQNRDRKFCEFPSIVYVPRDAFCPPLFWGWSGFTLSGFIHPVLLPRCQPCLLSKNDSRPHPRSAPGPASQPHHPAHICLCLPAQTVINR